jgi:hypothetical protein
MSLTAGTKITFVALILWLLSLLFIWYIAPQQKLNLP